jgi:fructoselysine-6-P-deglycase FrlB-like protein
VIGRGPSYPLALEAALKVKEVSYVHAEGFAGGELKHGVIALIEPGTPCLVLAPCDETYVDVISGAMQMKARGAVIISRSLRRPHPGGRSRPGRGHRQCGARPAPRLLPWPSCAATIRTSPATSPRASRLNSDREKSIEHRVDLLGHLELEEVAGSQVWAVRRWGRAPEGGCAWLSIST